MPRDMGAATNALGPEVSPSTDGGGSLLPDLRIQSGFSVKLRVGGRQDGKAWSPFATYSGPLRIGAAANGAKGFNGLIDRVRVYNMAISDEDMIAHGNGIYEPCAASAECVADWTFDQERDGAFASTGRRPFPAKIVGEIKTADSRDGKAIDIKMNGLVATGWIEVAFDPAFDLREAFSLEAWILFTNDCGSKCAFYNVYDRAPAFDLEIHGGSWVARRGGGVSVPPLASFPGGRKWSHIGLTYTKHELRVFKDGKLSKTINP